MPILDHVSSAPARAILIPKHFLDLIFVNLRHRGIIKIVPLAVLVRLDVGIVMTS